MLLFKGDKARNDTTVLDENDQDSQSVCLCWGLLICSKSLLCLTYYATTHCKMLYDLVSIFLNTCRDQPIRHCLHWVETDMSHHICCCTPDAYQSWRSHWSDILCSPIIAITSLEILMLASHGDRISWLANHGDHNSGTPNAWQSRRVQVLAQ